MKGKNGLKLNKDYILREIEKKDQNFLFEMLYQSIYVDPNSPPTDREIINAPQIRKYVEDWGKEGDSGFIAIDKKTEDRIGAIWLRFFNFHNKGYGYINEDIPELGIAVDYEKRSKGIGSALMHKLLSNLNRSISSISLSVEPKNPAVKLYENIGFIECGAAGASIIMRYDIKE